MSIFKPKNRKDKKKEVENKDFSKSVSQSELNPNGISPNVITPNGVGSRGINPNGVSPNGVSSRGINPNGVTPNGVSSRRINPSGTTPNGTTLSGVTPGGANPMEENYNIGYYDPNIPWLSTDHVIQKNPLPKIKQLVEKKLTVILIENTDGTKKIKDTLVKIINSTVSSGLICVIKYGSCIRQSQISDVVDFNGETLLSGDNEGNFICLYDALQALEDLVNKEYMVTHEKEFERERVNQIEIIGIGTCKDNHSALSKETGIRSFCNIAKKSNITTKYFCLTEESFVYAAEIGFHSIGAISRNY